MIKNIISKILNSFGYELIRRNKRHCPTGDMEKEFCELFYHCIDYTMTSVERMYALYKAVDYICTQRIPGSIVECGVWKGGSSMLTAHTFMKKNEYDRIMYLYDTYSGMSEPSEKDVKVSGGQSARPKWADLQRNNYNEWAYASLQEVKDNMQQTGYPNDLLFFIEGKVEDTIPGVCPEQIALLRLDTDWYESTCHELTHLFPKLVSGGVLIIDDYGNWKGAKEAVDEYLQQNNINLLLNRIDCTGRIGVKS